MIPQGTTEKRFDTDYYVEGFATTFNKPYVMYEYGGIKYCEMIDRNALVGADLSDVIMQFDHSGMVFARNKMAKNKPPSPYRRGEARLCERQRHGRGGCADADRERDYQQGKETCADAE